MSVQGQTDQFILLNRKFIIIFINPSGTIINHSSWPQKFNSGRVENKVLYIGTWSFTGAVKKYIQRPQTCIQLFQ